MHDQPPKSKELAPGLNSLELLGALSARLAHALSNHLAVISGNLHFLKLAAASQDARTASALDAAIQASENAGNLLGRFVELRRSLEPAGPVDTAGEVCSGMRELLCDQPRWQLELDPALGECSHLATTIPSRWIRFAVGAIVGFVAREGEGGSVFVTFTPDPPRASRPPLWPLVTPPAGFLRLCLRYASTQLLSWEDVRMSFSDWNLVAVYELVRDAGGMLDAETIQSGHQQVVLALPLVEPAAGQPGTVKARRH